MEEKTERMESANERYRKSGSDLSFKDWINSEREKGYFIYNKKLNNKIQDMKQSIFRQADGTTSTVAAPPTSDPNQKITTGKIVKYMVLGSALTAIAIIVFKALKKG
ncbi:MAG: hypothetical protein ACRDE2_00065 [Chitinophagaceae bacterium]